MRRSEIRLAALLVVLVALIIVLVPRHPTDCLEGTIRIPKGWHVKHFRLHCMPTGEPMATRRDLMKVLALVRETDDSKMTRDGADNSKFSWSLGEIPPGEYQLDVPELGATWSVFWITPGTKRLDLVIPDPVDLVVRVQSWEEDGEEIKTVAPSWRSWGVEPGPSMEGGPATWNSKLGAFVCKVPAGSVTLEVPEEFEVVHNETVQVPPGGCEVRIVVKQSSK